MTARKVIADPRQAEVDRNYAAFAKMLPDLMARQAGRYALMHDGRAIEFLDSFRDAVLFGNRLFGDGRFSVQQVTDDVIDLGYQSRFPVGGGA